MIGKTLDGMITSWNRGAERLYGYAAGEVVGKSIALLLLPEEQDELTRIIEHLQRGEKINQDALRCRKDGTLVDVSLTISPIQDRHGVITGASTIAHDITRSKQTEKQLIIERQRAEEATQAKSAFLANMSHEIRTPMNGVIGAAGLLLGTNLTIEQREYAEIVRNSGEALLDIINDILDFSKIEAGKLTIETIPFDLRVLLEEVDDLLTPRVQGRPLTLRFEYPSDVPTHFLGDPGRIRQITLNLASNAVKFTATGEVVIRIRCDLRLEQTAVVRISVSDTGPGIAASKLHFLFKKFSQLDASTSRKYGGTGLGLAISKQLVELMNGAIGVDSKEGDGATFWFALTLPLDPRRYPDEPGQHSHDPAGLWGNFAASGARVLVAEDNVVNQKVAVRMLEKLGIRADVAGNGREAVQMFAGLAYDALLMDCQMPDMDGYQATREIRGTEEADQRVPIIAMTADAFAECRDRCKEAGMDDYLAKPVRLQQLAEVLKKWLPARS